MAYRLVRSSQSSAVATLTTLDGRTVAVFSGGEALVLFDELVQHLHDIGVADVSLRERNRRKSVGPHVQEMVEASRARRRGMDLGGETVAPSPPSDNTPTERDRVVFEMLMEEFALASPPRGDTLTEGLLRRVNYMHAQRDPL